MKATEAKAQSTEVAAKAYEAAKAMIRWAVERNKSDVDIAFELMTPDLKSTLEAEGYQVAFHRDNNGVCFNITWESAINYEMRAKMFDALKHKSSDAKLRFAIERCQSGMPYELESSYSESVFQGDIRRAAKLCGLGDFQLLLKVQSVLV